MSDTGQANIEHGGTAVPNSPSVLVVDDDEAVLHLVTNILKMRGFQVKGTQSPGEALLILDNEPFHIILADQMMPGMRGTDLIRAAKEKHPCLQGLIMTGYGSKDTAVAAIKAGAYDFLEKPFSPDIVTQAVDRAWTTLRMQLENRELLERLKAANAALREEVDVRRAAEEALASSRSSFHNIVERSVVGAAIVDDQGSLRFANAAARAFLGEGLEQALSELAGTDSDMGHEITICREGGGSGIAEVRIVPSEWEGAKAWLVSLHDITERKEAEQKVRRSQAQLIQAEKMTAIGTMTAGVAHELNNPLMGILNFAQYCARNTPEDDKKRSILEDVERETRRCIDIVSNLLTFSRADTRQQEGPCEADCLEMLERVLKLLTFRITREGVSVSRDVPEGLPKVRVRANGLQQVFLNLVTNALDALAAVEGRDKELRLTARVDGDSVEVTLTDNGCGIDPAIQDRIFDPFFTTKSVGCGTGLGLAMSLSLVQEDGGSLTVQSQLDEGAAFTLRLPLAKE